MSLLNNISESTVAIEITSVTQYYAILSALCREYIEDIASPLIIFSDIDELPDNVRRMMSYAGMNNRQVLDFNKDIDHPWYLFVNKDTHLMHLLPQSSDVMSYYRPEKTLFRRGKFIGTGKSIYL